MLENFIITCNIMLPLIIYLIVGVTGRRTGMLGEDFKTAINKFLNKLLMPMTAFNSIYKADLKALVSGSGPAEYTIIATVAFMLLLMFVYRFIEKDSRKRAAMVHCSIRGNSMLYGLPVATAIYGPDDVGEIVVVLAAVLIVYNIGFVLVLEYYRSLLHRSEEQSGGTLASVKGALVSCARNRILQAIALALIVNISGVKVPSFLQGPISELAGMTVVLSFILMGVRLDVNNLRGNSRDVLIASAVKLVVMPAMVSILPLLWGWRGKAFSSVFLCFSTSSAVSCFPFTEALEGDGELAGEIVMASAVLSGLTMFLWIFGLKQLGII